MKIGKLIQKYMSNIMPFDNFNLKKTLSEIFPYKKNIDPG